jgi:hypothetical protein
VEGQGLVTGARRGLRPAALALVLAAPVLAGCDAAQQALADVEAAARRLAAACDVNVDQVGG